MAHLDYIDDTDAEEDSSAALVINCVLPLEFRGDRIDKAIAKALPNYSRSKIQQWLEAGLVFDNTRQIHSKDHAAGLENLHITVPQDPQNTAFTAEEIPLEIVYSDADIAIICKPFGMVVHPAAGNWSGTLLNALLHHFPECSLVPRAGIVHRLDKDTSGLLVIAKNIEAQHSLVQQLQNKTMDRQYMALAWGKTPQHKVVHGAIGRDSKDRLKMGIQSKNGKESTTRMTTCHQVQFEQRTISLVNCTLETGRTHQIRVHLESLGHALINDPVYKNKIPFQVAVILKAQLLEQGIDFPGQFLHAGLLGLEHPRTKDYLRFEQNAPDQFVAALQFLQFPAASYQDFFAT